MPEYQAKGRYQDSKGRWRTFNITTDSGDNGYIRDLIRSQYSTNGSVTVYSTRNLTDERVVKDLGESLIPSFPSSPGFQFHTGDNEDIGTQHIRLITRLLEITFYLLKISFFLLKLSLNISYFILKISWNVTFVVSKFIYNVTFEVSKFIYQVVSNETNQERVKRIISSIYYFLRKTLFNLGNWEKLGTKLSTKVSWTITRINLFSKNFYGKLKPLLQKRSLNILVEEGGNKNKETNKFKNNPSIKNRFFPKSKKTINNFFIIFSVILSLVLGNEIRKSYPFYKVGKKVPESKKSNRKIIKIEPKSMDDENNKLKRINLTEGKVQKNLSINSFSKKFKRKDRKYLKPSIGGSEEINFYFNRALDNERLGRYQEAIADYDLIAEIKISERDYHYENALFYRAWLKIKNRKNHKGAIEDMEKLIIMNPYNIDLKIDLATFYSKNNKNRKAVQILDKAIEENPNEGNLYYWKGIYKNEYSYPAGCRYINKSKKLKASDWYPGPWGNC